MDSVLPPADSRERFLVETFVELADTLVDDFDVIDFFASLTDRVASLEIGTEAGILLANDTGSLQFVAASHERAHLLELFVIQNHEGPCLDCFATGAPVSIDELKAEVERWPLFAPRAIEAGYRSVQAVPLRLRGDILGALNIFLNKPGGIRSAELSVVQAMADVATIGLMQQREIDRANTVQGQLQGALQSRITIEQAKGIVAAKAGIPMDVAFTRLRNYARSHNQKLQDAAQDIVNGALDPSELT